MVKLLDLDIMSPSVGFTINKNDTYKTYIGFLLTMLYLCCIALAFVGFGRDIFKKKNPNVVYNKEITTESGYMFNSSNIIFTLYESSSWKPIIDYEKKFFAYWEVFYNYPGGYDTATYYFEKCRNEVLDEFNSTLTTPREYYYCLKQGTVLDVRGSRDDVYFYSSRLNVDFCENARFNKTDCLPLETIKQVVPARITMSFNFYDFYADSMNYTTPIKKTFFQGAVNSAVDNFGRLVVTFSNIHYYTDVGWIIEDNRLEKVSSVASATHTNLNSPGTKTIFSQQFLNSSWLNVYKRKYIKIQEVFANIGGIINIINIIFKIVCDYLVKPDILGIFYNQINKSHLLNNGQESDNDKKSQKVDKNPNILKNNFVGLNQIINKGIGNKLESEKKSEEKNDFKKLPDNSLNESGINKHISKNNSFNNSNKQVSNYFDENNENNDNRENKENRENRENKRLENDKKKTAENLPKNNNGSLNAVRKLSSVNLFQRSHERISLKLNLDNKVKRLLDFEYEDFNFVEKIFRPCLCGNDYGMKLEKFERVKEIYNETFSIEYSASNYRKLEIIRFLMFNEAQNKVIENMDLPELGYYLDFDYFESVKKITNQQDNDDIDMINFKLKMLLGA